MAKLKIPSFNKIVTTLGGWVGFTVLTVSIWVFASAYLSEYNNQDNTQHNTIFKKSSLFSTFKQDLNTFSETEVKQITNELNLINHGVFNSSTFRVVGSVELPRMGKIATDLFFESLPNELLDIPFPKDLAENTIPIIIPKNYLNLYNLGFSRSQGLPQVSPAIIKTLVFNLDLYGNNKHLQYKGKIAGFTTRYNTLLIPEKTLEILNQELSPTKKTNPVKIAIHYSQNQESAIYKTLDKRNIEIEENNSYFSYLQKTGTILLISISLLSFLIITLSGLLIISNMNSAIEKESTYISRCYEMGYHPKQLMRQFLRPSTIETITIVIPALVFSEILRLQFLRIMDNPWTFQPFAIATILTIGIGTLLWLFQIRKLKYELNKRFQ
ncbi:MAG: hypothetical protein PHU27_07395 [Salinivirgaceae bacterium]|nr:hypothetical protein [Salinivirgaceae bacterium]MDD4747364.1 hypothetical protein [Salinivirgaceae bacterium]MDY0279478.1 hypothetical protein [Salinivirgaceae bacterium]